MLKRERFGWGKLGLEIAAKGVFLQRQRLNSPAMRGFIAQRPVE